MNILAVALWGQYMSVVEKMNKTKYSSLKTLFIMVVVVVVAAIALLQAGSPKMTDAQRLSQPILHPVQK